MSAGRTAAALLAGPFLCGCGAQAGAEPWFSEEALASGLDFEHRSGASGRFDFPEIMGGGVGLLDYDGDGWLDVYFVQSAAPAAGEPARGSRLFRNRGGGRFEDVTARAGVAGRGYGMGCACADYDGDGDTDLFVTCVGPDVLFRNEGDGTFRDVTAQAGVGDIGWGTSACFVDYDLDGRLDLLVANYLRWSRESELECQAGDGRRDYCHPNHYKAPATAVLFHNEGGGVFRDVSAQTGLSALPGNGLGVAWGDFDRDGRVDLFVANDMMPNRLWLNRGGRFEDRALILGCALSGTGFPESGMGVQAVDLGEDGDLDLLISHMRHQKATLYESDGGMFDDASAARGLALATRPFTGFGLGFADFDHDGLLDLYLANGRVALEPPYPRADDPYAEESLLLRQRADGRFEEVDPRGGVSPRLAATSRGAAFGDLDNDGDVDLVVVNRDARARFLRNRAGERGSWILLRVVGATGADAIGATVRIRAGDRGQSRRVDPGYSYLSSNDPRVHFGLGQAEAVDEILVLWPDGCEERFEPRAARALYVLRRGEGAGRSER